MEAPNKTLTPKQMKSLHKLYANIANYCVETGLDQRTVVTALATFQCPVTPQFVKETWRAMQVAMIGKTSTTELLTSEVDQVYEVFGKFWSELTGNAFPFPALAQMLDYDETYYK
jgi:hypothetical protein